jgi:hypothetical protein
MELCVEPLRDMLQIYSIRASLSKFAENDKAVRAQSRGIENTINRRLCSDKNMLFCSPRSIFAKREQRLNLGLSVILTPS